MTSFSLFKPTDTCTVQNENTAVPAGNSKPVWIRNVACSGAELTLLECSHDSTTYEDDHSKDVGVHCQQREFFCILCGK